MEASPSPEPLVPDRPSPTTNRVASAAAMVLLVALALSGAARGEGGVLLGIPSIGIAALSALAGALTWGSGVTGLAALLLPAALGLAAAALPPFASALLLFSGRPLLAFVFAGLTLTVLASGRRPPRWLLLPFFAALYACVSYQVQTRVGPDGDEPQYLMVSESLIRDHDLVLDADFKEERYRAFFSRPLAPDFRIRGPEGQIYSLHAVGLSLLILPAYRAFGYAGASFFMAFLAALLIRELRRLVNAVTSDEALAEGTAWLVGLSPPLIHFAGLIFTEIPAALLLCVGLRAATFSRRARSALLSAGCAAALPWLNVRYSILSLAVVIALGWRLAEDARARPESARRARDFVAPALILIGSAVAISLYHHALWGFFDPRRVYGRRREFSLAILPEGLPGLFFDQEFGLFVYAPIFVLCLAGFVHLFRVRRSLAIAGLVAAGGVIATASVWPMWRGGFNPPARFLVPLVSILAVTLALALRRAPRSATALLAGWSLWCGIFGAMNIETVHRDRDGVAPFFRTQAGAREWTQVLPSFVLPEDRPARVLMWPWAALLSLSLFGAIRGRRTDAHSPRGRETLVPVLALMIAAAIADRLSPRAPSPERDATRLVGSPSVAIPSFRLESETTATWTMSLFYEPHRSPGGMIFARALPLPPGNYEVTLEAADPISGAPTLIVADHRSGRNARHAMAQSSVARSLTSTIVVSAASEFDLSLVGGEPLSLVRASLRRDP